MKYIIILIGALGAVLIAGWLGLQVQPKPFPAYPEQTPALNTVELPADLPAPVARYYKTIMGDQVPVIESAVISGRGKLRVFGLRFPARFRFTHVAGHGYRHYIEATVFGYPVYAPCDGRVLRVENDLPDLIPPDSDEKNKPGNYVFLECNGIEILLAQLEQGSVMVQPGDRVAQGQQVGAVGNSGNTSEPHLHIHAQRGGSDEAFLDGDPVPILFDGRYMVCSEIRYCPEIRVLSKTWT